MELIKLSPDLGVDPSLRLRSPAEVLLNDYMLPDAMSLPQLARRTGIPARHLRALLAGVRPVTPRNAMRLAAVLPTTALYWLVLQARYDLESALPGGRNTQATRQG
ncbi:HigA family addiction module antitoxin [Dyella sp. C9]|uniref:HigA family addiction module antitoxin n=1 Tax=Dyella sp. C9 TaxID=2202154 RepID=UPI000DEFD3CB|nr:HigA family addiction module antitoxin [Dyella sp. C9]